MSQPPGNLDETFVTTLYVSTAEGRAPAWALHAAGRSPRVPDRAPNGRSHKAIRFGPGRRFHRPVRERWAGLWLPWAEWSGQDHDHRHGPGPSSSDGGNGRGVGRGGHP